jgi:hypothetical protein
MFGVIIDASDGFGIMFCLLLLLLLLLLLHILNVPVKFTP